MLKLSPRMQLIYEHLIPGQPVWDLCCDHGYLGLNAYESGAFPRVYFVDQVPEIIQRLQETFRRQFPQDSVTSRAQFVALAGEALTADVTGTLVIAGVGAHTIINIVQTLHSKDLLKADKLILAPQKDEQKLLKFMAEQVPSTYQICNEHYNIIERGRTRKLLIFTRI